MARTKKSTRSTASRVRGRDGGHDHAGQGERKQPRDHAHVLADDTTGTVSAVAPATMPADLPAIRRRRRFTLRRVLVGIAAVALLLILAGFAYVYWTVHKTLPTISGTVQLPGLSAQVTVTRDIYGVPHITAASIEDLYMAQGYVHAQDRLFQMFLFRAAGQGRLAEYFGPSLLEQDIFVRTVGFRRAAEAEFAQLDPQVRARLEAYARGVNAFIHSHADSLPLEFTLAGIEMEDWHPVDSVTFGKLQAWDLTDSWDSELLANELRAHLGPERAARLLPGYPEDGPSIVPDAGNRSGGLLILRNYSERVRPYLPGMGLEGLGSNNWVVDGHKSATGKPLLANDPHLGARNPSIWYQAHLTTTDGRYDMVGFGFAGAPGLITGHNRHIAWGVTNTGADVQDLFIEKLDPQGHPGHYLAGDRWLPMQLITETFRVKGREPVTHTVRITGHGPIISDALLVTDTLHISLQAQPYALQWTASRPGKLLEAVHDLQTASNWQEFRAALSKWSVPGQNFVYADREGNIGYQMTGELPVRKKGDGSLPVPGWTGEYDWVDFIPFDQLPSAYNPPGHFIATANHKPFGPGYRHPIYGAWSYPWRINRIIEMIQAKQKLGIEDFKTMLMDVRSPVAEKTAPIIARLKSDDEYTRRAIAMFDGWNGDIKADSPVAAIYEVTYHRALTETFGDEMSRDLLGEYLRVGGATAIRSLELLLDKPDDPLWDRKDTPRRETRDDILLTSLQSALSDLQQALGEDMSRWQWGQLHVYAPAHPFSAQPLVSSIFSLPAVPVGGDGTTVAVASYSLVEPFTVRNHQSYRMIIDVGDWSRSLAIYGTGQSGQPYSRHWGDMLSVWQKGGYNPMLYTPEQIAANEQGTLTLVPAPR
jgi:penicillin amidase